MVSYNQVEVDELKHHYQLQIEKLKKELEEFRAMPVVEGIPISDLTTEKDQALKIHALESEKIDLKQRLFDFEANYEALDRTLKDCKARYAGLEEEKLVLEKEIFEQGQTIIHYKKMITEEQVACDFVKQQYESLRNDLQNILSKKVV